MIKITLLNGNKKDVQKGTTPNEIAQQISSQFAKKILSAKLNDTIIETDTPLNQSGKLSFYTWDDAEGKQAFWHSSAHVLAQVLKKKYPKIDLTIGPAIENGFYYDVALNGETILEKDFKELELEILQISHNNHSFLMQFISKKEALAFYEKNKYKTELIESLTDGEITFCRHDDFSDLCRGGHIPHTGYIKAVKILNIAGAYWRGNEKNTQLTRIYGISFPKQKLLTEYLTFIEEAKKRDHRKLGKELGFFAFSKKVGLGLPLWLPKGAALRERLEQFLKKAQKEAGYESVISPHIGEKNLYMTSGHYEKYGSDSFQSIKTPDEREEFLLKPMNCPHHCEIYRSKPWSYRDLPKRYAEFGTVYRYEQSGELHGLMRVRGFTQDDAHIFCMPNQLETEFIQVIDLVLYVFKTLGFEDFTAQVSLRDSDNPSKYIGEEKNWVEAENAIINATKKKNLNYKIVYGEAAFYGPKLDFMVKDALNRNWQLGTIQVDYNLPVRFDLSYIGSDDKPHRPVMIHRAPLGSLERFIAILLEHTGGVFPLWLASNQVTILTINKNVEKYCEKVLKSLEKHEIRSAIDSRGETMGKKIRDAEKSKVPFILVIGEKEKDAQTLSIRKHSGKKIDTKKIDDFINLFKEELKNEYKPFKQI